MDPALAHIVLTITNFSISFAPVTHGPPWLLRVTRNA